MSQDGTLCVWESDTEPEGLVLQRRRDKEQSQTEEEEEEEEKQRLEGQEGEVIRGKADTPKDKGRTKNVRYKQRSK